MKTSESIVNITKALLTAQKTMEAAVKDSKNPYFKSSYADYNSVLQACKGPLNSVGVVILQPHVTNERGTFVETILLHETGEFISSETQVTVAKANDPQALGSAITYARRYGLQSLVSLPAEDDDGEKAMARDSKFSNGKLSASQGITRQEVSPVTSAPSNGVKTTFKKQTVETNSTTDGTSSSNGSW
jgi:hypothetical protein